MKTMTDYELRCTVEQTRKAWKLGAPITLVKSKRTKETIIADDVIEFDDDTFTYIVPPTTQQMRGWLRKEKGITITIFGTPKDLGFTGFIWYPDGSRTTINLTNIHEQAELAAIDTVLDYLEKGNTK